MQRIPFPSTGRPAELGPVFPGLRRLLRKTRAAGLAWALAPLAALGMLMAADAATTARATPRGSDAAAAKIANTGSAAPAIPPVKLASGTLRAAAPASATAVDKAALTLVMSIEYPNAGAQYSPGGGRDTDDTYTTEREYLGYYDAESCYSYVDNPQDSVTGSHSGVDYKRFKKTGQANGRKCTQTFSGNFLNWASSSMLDILRQALTGGDRYIDDPGLTILQRAILPSALPGDRSRNEPPEPVPVCIWNSKDFPAKVLKRNGGGSRTYWGAVPASMITRAMDDNNNDIYVANKLNRIYFGTSRTGSCDDSSAYTLGTIFQNQALGPVRDTDWDYLPDNSTKCANQDGYCNFSGIREVWYGMEVISRDASVYNGRYWKVAPALNGVDCTNGKFGGDPRPGYQKACYIAPYAGGWKPGVAAGSLNSDGFFYARVQVCDSASGNLLDSRDYDFCQRYPNGNYKPTGVIQKYSDRMRLAVFGYLMERNQFGDGLNPQKDRIGGVLRAPMKYVGRTTYDINGRDNTPAGGNPGAEWDADTGVLRSNPDHMDWEPSGRWPDVSGVINYLNTFGRTGHFGMYRQAPDPLAELYYEALRYLQGLPPTKAAINGRILGEQTEYFPYYDIWSDPYGGGRSPASDYSCTKNNILVIGDVNEHGPVRQTPEDRWVPIYDDGDKNEVQNIFHIRIWNGVVDSFEHTGAENYLHSIYPKGYDDGYGITRYSVNPNIPETIKMTSIDRNEYRENWNHGLFMGMGYWARTHDIRGRRWTREPGLQRPGLRVKTMVYDVNRDGAQNDANTRRKTNPLFMAAKYGAFETDPNNPDGRPYNDRGNPFFDRRGRPAAELFGRADNKVWEKADESGEAAGYYFHDSRKFNGDNSRKSPGRATLDAFDDIFHTGSRPSAAGSSSPTMGNQIIRNKIIYTARFDTAGWSGDVVATPVTNDASADNSLAAGADLWSAAQRLDAMLWSERKIFIGKAGDNSAGRTSGNAATLFRWDSLDNTLREQLDRPAPNAQRDGYGTMRTLFLRGDRSYDGDQFRRRKSLLGDMINSNISYSGAPRKRAEGPGYAAFYQKYTSPARNPVVFAGANDGMLHAFDAATGEERFAYIPGWMGPKLSALADHNYASAHQSYVDGPSVVSEARTGTTDTTAEDWKTVLVSGTGGGGSGVFALDVSDPVNFSAANVMWEFTRADDPNIGEVVGAPKIMKIKTANATATEAAKYRWFAVVAGGVNNYVPDGAGRVSTSGKPALFLLALDKALGAPWILGTNDNANANYYRVDIPVDATLSATQATGVLNFSALYGSQGEMTDLYFGDLHGQVWRLQFSGKPPADWSNMDRLSFFKKTDGATAKPLFIARSGEIPPKVQPISAAPTLLVGPRVAGRETFHVLFGTGKYLEASDNTTTGKQSVYALLDNGDPAASTHDGDAAVITARLHLFAAFVDKAGKKVKVSPFLWGYPKARSWSDVVTALNGASTAAPADTPSPGWYFDLPETGERVDLAGTDLGALTVAINSRIPAALMTNAASTASTGCVGGSAAADSSGGGNEYVLNVNTGAADYSASTVGLLGAPMFLSNSSETVTGARDSAGRRIALVTHRRWSHGQSASQAGDSGNSLTGKIKTPEMTGLLSWRRISNYQDLRHPQPAGNAAAAASH